MKEEKIGIIVLQPYSRSVTVVSFKIVVQRTKKCLLFGAILLNILAAELAEGNPLGHT